MNANTFNRFISEPDYDQYEKDTLFYQNAAVYDLFINSFPSNTSLLMYTEFQNDVELNVSSDMIMAMESKLNKIVKVNKLVGYNQDSNLVSRFNFLMLFAEDLVLFSMSSIDNLTTEDKLISDIEKFLKGRIDHVTYYDLENVADHIVELVYSENEIVN